MTVAEIKHKAETERKLAVVLVLKAVEQSGGEGTHLNDLAIRVRSLRHELNAEKVTLRFGYRNQLDEFVRSLFMMNFVSLAYDKGADTVTCRITDPGKNELRASPPESLLQILVQ